MSTTQTDLWRVWVAINSNGHRIQVFRKCPTHVSSVTEDAGITLFISSSVCVSLCQGFVQLTSFLTTFCMMTHHYSPSHTHTHTHTHTHMHTHNLTKCVIVVVHVCVCDAFCKWHLKNALVWSLQYSYTLNTGSPWSVLSSNWIKPWFIFRNLHLKCFNVVNS